MRISYWSSDVCSSDHWIVSCVAGAPACRGREKLGVSIVVVVVALCVIEVLVVPTGLRRVVQNGNVPTGSSSIHFAPIQREKLHLVVPISLMRKHMCVVITIGSEACREGVVWS